MWRNSTDLRWGFCLVVVLTACRPLDMYDQEKYEPYEHSEFFPDGRSARLPPAGTVARKAKDDGDALPSGTDAQSASQLPFDLKLEHLKRGQERFNIYCTPCHGLSGYGDGMIVLRGYTRPPSFHTERLRQLPVGHYYQVISEGFGAMPAYGTQIAKRDRWLIIAYIQALQFSQQVPVEVLPAQERKKLEGG